MEPGNGNLERGYPGDYLTVEIAEAREHGIAGREDDGIVLQRREFLVIVDGLYRTIPGKERACKFDRPFRSIGTPRFFQLLYCLFCQQARAAPDTDDLHGLSPIILPSRFMRTAVTRGRV